ncbi:MAG: heme o synthase [Phycisphaerales bacterium]|jgi:protoheme IX farnesyltransferase|nr:heme o synthase [Phycisphaerales bacterium]MDP6890146.1 heme o synthase [Phycisphaerales bacterium]
MANTATTHTNSHRTASAGLLSLYADLVKLRLSLLVVLTAGVGCIMASGPVIDWLLVLWTATGTLACAAAANAINQVVETHRDAMMDRTRTRPLPAGHLSPAHGWVVAMLLAYAGITMLALLVNLFAAGLALLTLLIYVLAYTPLKPRSTLNTLIGAVVGSIPPLIGWVAVRDQLDIGAWTLAAILFLWQLPHFLSLAWMYRDQYERAGFRMLPSVKGGEHAVCQGTLVSTVLLLPLSLLVVSFRMAGVAYAVFAILIGLWFVWKSVLFYRHRTQDTAKGAFLSSLLYLPLLLLAMVFDRVPQASELIITLEPVSP